MDSEVANGAGVGNAFRSGVRLVHGGGTNGHSWHVEEPAFSRRKLFALSIIFSARATLGLAMPHVEAEMGWTRSFMSAVMSATLVFMAVMAPVAGRLLDRIGPRIVLLVGTVSVVVGSVVLALAAPKLIRGMRWSG